jgi:hypothetical protein
MKMLWPRAFCSWPIDTQVSVMTQSAPLTARFRIGADVDFGALERAQST